MQIKPLIAILLFLGSLSGASISSALAHAKSPGNTHPAHDSKPSQDVLTLTDAIKRAIESSPRLGEARANLESAEGSEAQAGYWPNPEFAFEAENIVGSGPYKGTKSAEYTYSINQTVDIGGKTSTRKMAAQEERKGAHAGLLIEQLKLERDVRIAFINAIAAKEAMNLASEQEALAKNVLSTVSKRVNAAAEPEIQRSKAEVAYSTSKIAHAQKKRQRIIAEENLARIWGDAMLDQPLDDSHFFVVAPPEPIEVYQAKIKNIPDSKGLDFHKAAKEALLELEQAQVIPDLNVTVGIRDFRETKNQALVFGITVPLPILNQNRGNIKRASAELTKARMSSRQIMLMLEQELTTNWQNCQASYDEVKSLKNNLLPAAEKSFKLARKGYGNGNFPYLDVLDAQRTLFDARAQYFDALKRYHTAFANILRLTTIPGE